MFTGSILIIASNQTLTQQLIALLRAEGFSQIEYALSTSDARKKVVFFDPDMIIINSPLCGEPGNDFILDISERTTSNLLILTTGEFFLDMQYELQHIGAIIISKPLNRSIFVDTLHFVAHFSRYLGATFDYDTTLHTLWNRRQTTKFNGVPYIVQRGAAAIFSEKGQEEVKELVHYYMKNAAIIRSTLDALGITYYSGINSPYIWLECPDGLTSWEFFDKLLQEIGVVGTPGSGFGPAGEGYFRLTAFGDTDQTMLACERLKKWLCKF